MKTSLKRAVHALLLTALSIMTVSAKVIGYSAPKGENLSADYVVEVDGVPIPVYMAVTQHHDKKYSVAYFDFSGTVTVRIKSKLSLEKLNILPDRYSIKPFVSEDVAVFQLHEPCDISFEPDGCNSPLLLFSNELETYVPSKDSPNVIYFGPGEHNPKDGLIKLSSNQTLYLAGGAVVNAGIEATGDNITICGRGILDGSDWEHNAGPTDFMINAKKCNNLVMKDIIIKGSYYWTVVPQNCDRVLIEHIRLAGSRVGNDDGVNPCNSSNVTIRNCFFRTDDDSVSPKGITRAGGEKDSKSVENITVENCVFWVDFANVFRMATESSCPAFRNFTARNIDVIHFPDRDRVQIFWLHPTGEMPMENLCFENIRINGELPYNLVKLTPAFQLVGTRPIVKPTPNDIKIGSGRRGQGSCGYGEFVVIPSQGPYIHNVIFRNITTYGKESDRKAERGTVMMQGLDEKHDVSGIVFDNVNYYGDKINAGKPNIQIGDFVKHVQYAE
ncbi:glycosyl hydrolase family 28 protein [Bacteroides stercorirosoris]|uniref:Glycosyl hydrolases family 28 n=1 Tax=Bacteroides stercorirosoris TaxID=871324 RepID=A0A1M6K330_9BACE|nr:glycosyl hydrolase family 28 protein [Bacteroides stercorirosoris]SHJ53324.1 Glycosyl hydrolases family 28 [Bacteroides stercorirosoris]